LDQFLSYLDGEELFVYFSSICNKIVKHVLTAVDFLHSRDIVHRDIEPANVLVSNLHYADLKHGSNEVFMSQPRVCKLAEMGEARSRVTQTRALVGNSRTKFLARGSPAFMAPEISVEEFMVTSASLGQLKAIDVWAVIMTFFVVINPDYRKMQMISQASALSENGTNVINMVQGYTEELAQTLLPQNDGTNACAFLSLGIIDRLLTEIKWHCDG
ncbi:LOW QUALITY PROTEIN: serine/threonine-protein kinase Chk2-like, partial [Rhopilema esculentum]|uniref:LOW QUALITY PROTEIN: serine/threonine-protein kinase Chk2-like n=1 Tax=Rhopilema esculentum TaxID=499914 RepID=UPI0031DF328F